MILDLLSKAALCCAIAAALFANGWLRERRLAGAKKLVEAWAARHGVMLDFSQRPFQFSVAARHRLLVHGRDAQGTRWVYAFEATRGLRHELLPEAILVERLLEEVFMRPRSPR